MKTKEINCWVSLAGLEASDGVTVMFKRTTVSNIKARLVVEMPEKEITITPNQLGGAFNKVMGLDSYDLYFKELEREVFGENE